MKLNPKALGMAVGLVKGTVILLATIYVTWMQGGDTLGHLSRFYLGYTVTYLGALVGFLYGLADGFVLAYIGASLYNFFSKE